MNEWPDCFRVHDSLVPAGGITARGGGVEGQLGGLVAGASAFPVPTRKLDADAPGRHDTGFSGGTAGGFPAVFHRPVVPGVPRSPSGCSRRPGGAPCAGCSWARACPRCGRTTGRTGSSRGRSGRPRTSAWRSPAWSWTASSRPVRCTSSSMTPCSTGQAARYGRRAGSTTAPRRATGRSASGTAG